MIQLQNLAKPFGTVKVVDGISFDVRAAEIFAFLGPNGAAGRHDRQGLVSCARQPGHLLPMLAAAARGGEPRAQPRLSRPPGSRSGPVRYGASLAPP
jgi:hypothetical protein